MPDLIARFEAEYYTLNSITDRRRMYAQRALRDFEQSLDGPVEGADANDLRAWMAAMMDRGLAASTVAWHLMMVRPFYRWLWEARLISAEDSMRIQSVSPPRGYNTGKPQPYSRKELAQLWAELDAKFPFTNERRIKRWRKGTSGYRNVKKHVMRCQLEAIIQLALVCGMRKNEIYELSLNDAHFDNHYIVVHGKRVDQHAKPRKVPYPDSAREAMKRWLRMRAWLEATHDCLWCSVTGPEPASKLRQNRMDTILHSFGDWRMHRLRHTCATERLRAGMEIYELQKFLGHANLSQTLAYAEIVAGDIEKAAEESDPEFQRAIRPQRVVMPADPKRKHKAA